MGLAAGPVRHRGPDSPWMCCEGPWKTRPRTSRCTTGVAQTNTQIDHLSTNRGPYPQVRSPYPHRAIAGGGRPRTLGRRVFSDRAGYRSIVGLAPAPSGTPSRRIGVQHLAKGADIAAEIVVLGHLPLDLLAAV